MKNAIENDVHRCMYNIQKKRIRFIENSPQTLTMNTNSSNYINSNNIACIPLTRQKAVSKEDIKNMKDFSHKCK